MMMMGRDTIGKDVVEVYISETKGRLLPTTPAQTKDNTQGTI